MYSAIASNSDEALLNRMELSCFSLFRCKYNHISQTRTLFLEHFLPFSFRTKEIIFTFVPDKSKQKSNQNTTRRIDSHFPANNKTFVFIVTRERIKIRKHEHKILKL